MSYVESKYAISLALNALVYEILNIAIYVVFRVWIQFTSYLESKYVVSLALAALLYEILNT